VPGSCDHVRFRGVSPHIKARFLAVRRATLTSQMKIRATMRRFEARRLISVVAPAPSKIYSAYWPSAVHIARTNFHDPSDCTFLRNPARTLTGCPSKCLLIRHEIASLISNVSGHFEAFHFRLTPQDLHGRGLRGGFSQPSLNGCLAYAAERFREDQFLHECLLQVRRTGKSARAELSFLQSSPFANALGRSAY